LPAALLELTASMRTRNRHLQPSAPKGLMVVADKAVILSSAPSSRRALGCYQGHRASLRGVSRAAGRLLVVLLAPYDIKGVVGTASWRRKWRVPRRGGGGHRSSRRCTVVGLAADTKERPCDPTHGLCSTNSGRCVHFSHPPPAAAARNGTPALPLPARGQWNRSRTTNV
jgi:hypothetical protein